MRHFRKLPDLFDCCDRAFFTSRCRGTSNGAGIRAINSSATAVAQSAFRIRYARATVAGASEDLPSFECQSRTHGWSQHSDFHSSQVGQDVVAKVARVVLSSPWSKGGMVGESFLALPCQSNFPGVWVEEVSVVLVCLETGEKEARLLLGPESGLRRHELAGGSVAVADLILARG